MKNKTKIILIIISIIILILLGIYLIKKYINKPKIEIENEVNNLNLNTSNEEMKEQGISEEYFDSVVITNNKVYNLEKLDQFIKQANYGLDENTNKTIQIVYYTQQKDPIIEKLTINEENENTDKTTNEAKLEIIEDYSKDKYLGENQEKIVRNEYSLKDYKIQRQYEKQEDEKEIIKIVLTKTNATTNLPQIDLFSYDLNNTNYERKFELKYNARKDMGKEKIISKEENDNYDCDVYTLAGDVEVIKNNQIYTFKEALDNKIITIEDILNQAKIDEQYGVCIGGEYSDGGTRKYDYQEYSIVKYNTLYGNKDFVVCPINMLLDDVTKNIYNS